MSDPIYIPEGLVPASRVNPQMLLAYAGPKTGKTTACAALPDSLILELEPSGADFVDARKIDITGMPHLLAVLAKLTAQRAEGKPACRRLVIDTIDEVEKLCDPAALAEYKRSVMGKDFAGTSITELPLGAGYGRLRDKLGETLWLFSKAAEEVILLAHVRDRVITKTAGDVSSLDIDLSGKCRQICCSRCSSIGFMRRDFADNLYINFRTSETVNCGSRCAHLTGKEILLGERKDGKLVFHWSRIYLDQQQPTADAPAPASTAP